MKWVTHSYAYLDRVASPWLIRRFVDPAAEFLFVDWGEEANAPADAIPFALPGAELGEHDADGTTFQKILAKYGLTDPTLQRLGRIVERGVDYTVRRVRPEETDQDGGIAFALMTISEGMMLVFEDDSSIVEGNFVVYDALYRSLKARELMAAQGKSLPASDGKGPTLRTEFLRDVLREANVG
jgi:hypothetical protein